MVVVPIFIHFSYCGTVRVLSEEFRYSFTIIQHEGLPEMFVHGFERFLQERRQTSRTQQRVVYASSLLP